MAGNPSKQSKKGSLVALLRKAPSEDEGLVSQVALYSVDATDKHGETALHVACEKGFEKVAQALLRAGACPDSRNWRHSTPLLKAISRAKNFSLVKLLITSGAEVNSSSMAIASPLVSAIQAGLPDVALLLVQSGADTRRISAAGTVLHAAVQTRSLPICEMVLNWPIEIDAENVIGETALSTAGFLGETQIAALLVRNGADPFRLGSCQMSPIQRADDVGEHEAAKVMAEQAKRRNNGAFKSHK
jgi:hypothetical protein